MDIYKIIEFYSDEFGFINNMGELFEAFALFDISGEQISKALLKICNNNNDMLQRMKKALTSNNKTQSHEENTSFPELPVKKEEKISQTAIPNVDNYVKALLSCDDDDFLIDLLPNKYDDNFTDIMISIMIKIQHIIIEIYKYMEKFTDKESQEYLQSEIDKHKDLLNKVKSYYLEENKTLLMLVK